MPYPPDSQVHSQWSGDSPIGDMEQSCVRAVELGLPAIAFTEHLDQTVWRIASEGPHRSDRLAALVDADGILTPSAFDAAGYLGAIERCRARFPQVTPTGVWLGQPYARAGTGLVNLTKLGGSTCVRTRARCSAPTARLYSFTCCDSVGRGS